MIAGDIEARIRQLTTAAADAARATETALGRLMLADDVCKALVWYLKAHELPEGSRTEDLLVTLEAWEKGQPS